jgi:hypothetical protein
MAKTKPIPPVTIRFTASVQHQKLHNELIKLADDCGVSFSDLVRNLIAIGLESYKLGAIVGFDGKVVLPSGVINSESKIPNTQTETDSSNNAGTLEKTDPQIEKSSLFLT